jgi:hypothetical protein
MSFNVYFDSYDFIRRAQVSSSIESYPDEIKQVLAKLKKDFESVSRNDLEGYLMFLSKKS